MSLFENLVLNLQTLGFYNFVLPFLLVFAIVFGLIAKSEVLGKSKGPAGIAALAIAFFVTAYSGIGEYFMALSGTAGMALAALLVVVLFFAMLGFSPDGSASLFKSSWFIGFLAVLGIIVFLVFQGATLPGGIALSEEAMAAIVMVIIVVLAMWFVIRDEKPKA